MNFARTNLSLLLARQNRQATQRSTLAGCRIALPRGAERLAPPAAQQMVAAAPRRDSQTLELIGALAMMAVFMVLALFG